MAICCGQWRELWWALFAGATLIGEESKARQFLSPENYYCTYWMQGYSTVEPVSFACVTESRSIFPDACPSFMPLR